MQVLPFVGEALCESSQHSKHVLSCCSYIEQVRPARQEIYQKWSDNHLPKLNLKFTYIKISGQFESKFAKAYLSN